MVLRLAPDLALPVEWQTRCHDHSSALSHRGLSTVAGDAILNTAACCPTHRELPIVPETEVHKASHCALHCKAFRHHVRLHARRACCGEREPYRRAWRVHAQQHPSLSRSHDDDRSSKTHI